MDGQNMSLICFAAARRLIVRVRSGWEGPPALKSVGSPRDNGTSGANVDVGLRREGMRLSKNSAFVEQIMRHVGRRGFCCLTRCSINSRVDVKFAIVRFIECVVETVFSGNGHCSRERLLLRSHLLLGRQSHE